MKKCSSEKVFFRKKDIADKRAKELSDEHRNDKKPLIFKSYRCPECKGFHLTSIDKKKKEKSFNAFLRKESDYWETKFGVRE